MDGKEILIENKERPLGLKKPDQFTVIDLGQNLAIAQWLESFLKELDHELEKGGNKLL